MDQECHGGVGHKESIERERGNNRLLGVNTAGISALSVTRE